MLQGVQTDMSSILIVWGSTAFFADFALAWSSREEDRWLRVKRMLKISLALVVLGAVVASSGLFLNILFPQNSLVALLVMTGAASFSLGIIVEVFSFARSRNKPPGAV